MYLEVKTKSAASAELGDKPMTQTQLPAQTQPLSLTHLPSHSRPHPLPLQQQPYASTQPVIAITGATQGLGYALAKQALQRGFSVSFCARSQADVERALLDLAQHGPVLGLSGDVADAAFRVAFIAQTTAQFGRLDAIVNNASTLGTLPLPPLIDSTTANELAVMTTNYLAPLDLLRQALPHLTQQPRSLAIAISSDAAVGGYEGWGAYGSSKAALDLAHKTLAVEMGWAGLCVYAVDPGDMNTAMHHAAVPDATGLTEPAAVAAQLLSLFEILQGEPALFPSGRRLQAAAYQLQEVL